MGGVLRSLFARPLQVYVYFSPVCGLPGVGKIVLSFWRDSNSGFVLKYGEYGCPEKFSHTDVIANERSPASEAIPRLAGKTDVLEKAPRFLGDCFVAENTLSQ